MFLIFLLLMVGLFSQEKNNNIITKVCGFQSNLLRNRVGWKRDELPSKNNK